MEKSFVYRLVPIAGVLVAGMIQTAVIAMSFTSAQWHIAALLAVCVWLVCAADGFVYHEITRAGGTAVQYIAVGISALVLVTVLGIDLVLLFAPQAFNTSDTIIHNLQYGTGVNLAVSLFCLLVWLFTSTVNEIERDMANEELLLIRQKRLEYLQSDRARVLIENDVENDHAERMAHKRKVSKHVLIDSVGKKTATSFVRELAETNGNGNGQHAKDF